VRSPGEVLVPDDLPKLEPVVGPAEALRAASNEWLLGSGGVDDPGKIPTLDEAERILILRALNA